MDSQAVQASNRYARALGAIAVIALGMTLIALVFTVISGGSTTAVLTSPSAIIGAVCGVLWLAVKALLDRR